MLSLLLHSPPGRLCLGLTCLLSLWNSVSGNKDMKNEKEEASFAAPELPASSMDLSALNLTELVNGMLNRALKDSSTFFSLLSITSYSSFAFLKFSVAIYNISNLKTVDPAKFPTRYCYCLNNRTNDFSDFTALLVDLAGNSTSYLTEIFKSTSILSVSQANGTDCIFICVMTGKSGRNLAEYWDMVEKLPVINYTFTSSMSGILATAGMAVTSEPPITNQPRLPSTNPPRQGQDTAVPALRTFPWTETAVPSAREETLTTAFLQLTSPAEMKGDLNTRSLAGNPSQTSPTSGLHTLGTQTPHPTKAPAPRYPQTGCPQPLQEGAVTAAPHLLATLKITPCLMELCRFFQQCLCMGRRRMPRTEAMWYCLEHYSWFLKNATYICQRVRRVVHSHTLKQKCLENICKSV